MKGKDKTNIFIGEDGKVKGLLHLKLVESLVIDSMCNITDLSELDADIVDTEMQIQGRNLRLIPREQLS